MHRILNTFVAGAMALLVLGGCSGDGDTKAATGTSTPASTTPGAPTTTVRPVDTSFTGQNSAQFCNLAKTYNDRFRNIGASSTPAQLRTATQEGRTAINQAVSAAPAEIKADIQALANVFGGLFTELEKVNFDASKVTVNAFAPLQTPEFQASTVRFQAYLKNVCGVS